MNENLMEMINSVVAWQIFGVGATVTVLGSLYGWSFHVQKLRKSVNEVNLKLHEAMQGAKIQIDSDREKLLAQQTQLKIFESRFTDAGLQTQNLKLDFERRLNEREAELRAKDSRILDLEKRRAELEGLNTIRTEEYNNQIRTLVQAGEDLNNEKKRLRDEEAKRALEIFEKRKAHWQNHEKFVIESLRNLCSRLDVIFYTEETFPLAKKPDFAIELGEQLVIFDAKAPADPGAIENFPEYLRKQAETMEKYLKQEGVRREGFLVVPTDVIGQIKDRLFYEMGGFKIFIVCPESLETIFRLFQKIEEFEIMESFDPQSQEDLAAHIGRTSRVLKRRVQVDQYMSDQMLDLLIAGESLPAEILDKARAKEKSFAVNPPRMDRGKNINLADLVEEQKTIARHPMYSAIQLESLSEQ